MIVECIICKTEFKAFPAAKRKYCSLACRDFGKSELRNCVHCNTGFTAKRSRITGGKTTGRFCSQDCYLAHVRNYIPVEATDWKNDYENGSSILQISKNYNIPYRRVGDVLKRMGVEISLSNTHDDFLSKIQVNDKTGCWEWAAGTHKQGYGVFIIKRKIWLAHRYAYQYYKDNVSDMVVCHKCDNPPCCNPDHLFLGTQYDNVMDSINKGRRPKKKTVLITN